jgi:hypothetical protein
MNQKVEDIFSDATQDPSLDDLVKTSSYAILDKLIIPDNPVNVYIYGETGLGKTSSVLHICREKKIPAVRVNLSYASDIDDLIGGLRIENGDTIFSYGPVIQAMIKGACLILDECDHANPRILMELQPIAEGKGYLVKKTGKIIYPSKGFRIVATGNSKGIGDMTGKYIGVNVLNRAFLDRFSAFIEFKNPSRLELIKIISNHTKKLNSTMVTNLAVWYEHINQAVLNGALTEGISVRKIIDISKLFIIFDIVNPAVDEATEVIRIALNSFDDETVGALIQTWEVVRTDDKVAVTDDAMDEDGNLIPF